MKTIDKLNDLFRTFKYRTPRLRTRLTVWLQFQVPGNPLVPAVCIDISEKGMGADLEQPFEVGSSATLVIPSLARPEPFIIPARVVSQTEQRHGFVFVPSTPEEVSEIAAAVRAVSGGKTPIRDLETKLLGQNRSAGMSKQ